MIVPQVPQVKRMVQYVGLPVLALIAWDVLIVLGYKVMHWEWVGSKHVPLALYGSAIGIIVGFRNNSSYGRWWEGRQLWGQIVNNSRSLARQVCATMRPGASDAAEMIAMQRNLVHHQVAYVHALRQQLRGLDPIAEIRANVPEIPEAELATLAGQKNVSLTLQLRMGDMLREARGRGWMDNLEWQAMDRNLDDLMDAQGGAERIKNTPMPKQYDFFPMLFVQIYCLLLPIGMVENLGWFTPLGSTLVGFMFLALDKIGRDLEDPFDNQIYDLPLTAICRTIEINLRQMLGETKLPEPEKPIHGVLW
ncbi:putative membrane protein [Granulicella rosea]|uniref:Putative membrane protein n=1 Tax=Granulicella rosea TaxID=474952 RepID=A0A239DPG3_9BACT|nr:bestrophin family ion channel [Granulicella rosea]SNS34390.1 putative membrane protein [Granulicella rosea]